MALAFTPTRLTLARTASVRPSVAAKAKAGNWLPGSDSPAYLDGSLPGDYGFDPLGLGDENLARMQEGELINGRWAMAAVPGCLIVEALGMGNWFDAPLWAVNGGTASYFGVPVPFDIQTLILIEIVSLASIEVLRNEETDPVKRCYPGGAFDPMGFSKDADKFNAMKVKEVKNGRLAMVSFLGYVCQHQVTGKGPLENLADHITSPTFNNFATNGTSLPPFAFPFLY